MPSDLSAVRSTLKDGDNPASVASLDPTSVPGLVMIFSGGAPSCVALPIGNDGLELGRGDSRLGARDPRMSRRHARVCFDGSRFIATDLGSHNGSAVDGEPLVPNVPRQVQRILRTGDTLFFVTGDIRPFVIGGVQVDQGQVMGPALQALRKEVERAARFGNSLHITGESGTGKESLAQIFHQCGAFAEGRFVPVNCAAIPAGVAERLLFGARRGAYSGATEDATGYIEAASRGTLFLDEIAELELGVQPKLLRVLESKELVPLGAWRPKTVELQICSASNKDLRSQVANGSFREDLYFRVGRPLVLLPPLRKRAEEIPWLVDLAVKRVDASLQATAQLVETCLMRPWPGNVRELFIEVRSAAQATLSNSSGRVELRDLSASAGSAFAEVTNPLRAIAPPMPMFTAAELIERQRLEETLTQNQGNISAAARALGMHRTQLRRLLDRYGLEPQRYG